MLNILHILEISYCFVSRLIKNRGAIIQHSRPAPDIPKSFIGDPLKRCPIKELGHDGSSFFDSLYAQGVLDESYMSFSERRTLGILPHVIRLGYVIADAWVIEQPKVWLAPWSTSTLALHLLEKLLPEADERDAQIQQYLQRLEALLHQTQWDYQTSEASFILAKPPQTMPDFAKHRILVRHFPEWQQLQGWVRLGFPYHQADWQRLERALCPSH